MGIKNSQLVAFFCFVSHFLVWGNQVDSCPVISFIELVWERTDLGFCPKRNEAVRFKIPPKKRLARSLKEWHFDDNQILLSTFSMSIDEEKRNFVREVRNSLFSSVKPTPLKSDIKLAAFSSEVLEDILDMSEQMKRDKEFLKV